MRQFSVVCRDELFLHRRITARVFSQFIGNVFKVGTHGAQRAPKLRRFPAVNPANLRERAEHERRFADVHVVVGNYVAHDVRNDAHDKREGRMFDEAA